jgi:integrase/recombinase XerC/integrase/recombinase XerD
MGKLIEVKETKTGVQYKGKVKLAVDAFLLEQDVKDSSKETYKRTLTLFFTWIEGKEYVIDELKREHIIEYKNDLLKNMLTSLTVNSYVTSIRKFYEWCESNKYYPNIAKGVKSPKRRQQFKKQPLTPKEGKRLLTHVKKGNRRDFALINLMIRTGLRTIEVARANVGDIEQKSGKTILWVHGKGRDEKDNFVILTKTALTPIRDYLNNERLGAKINEPLFNSMSNNSKGNRLSRRTVSKVVKENLKAIGINDRNYTAHSLRHTTAVTILKGGGSIEDAQFTLRHSNPATTQIYTATIKEEQRLKKGTENIIDKAF